MRFKRRKRMHTAVEAGSLSDILFFLMLFFLMISTLASPNAIKLLLPNAKSGKTIPHKKVNMYVDASGNIFLEKEPVPLENLQLRLEQLKTVNPETSVVLRADKNNIFENVINVVDVANQAKIPVVVATENKK